MDFARWMTAEWDEAMMIYFFLDNKEMEQVVDVRQCKCSVSSTHVSLVTW